MTSVWLENVMWYFFRNHGAKKQKKKAKKESVPFVIFQSHSYSFAWCLIILCWCIFTLPLYSHRVEFVHLCTQFIVFITLSIPSQQYFHFVNKSVQRLEENNLKLQSCLCCCLCSPFTCVCRLVMLLMWNTGIKL